MHPGLLNPLTATAKRHWDYNVGKRTFPDPRYAEWLMEAIGALMKRIGEDIRRLLPLEFEGKETAVFEVETGHGSFTWKVPESK